MAVTREELEACMRDVDGDAQLHLLADYEELDEDQREHLNEQLQRIFSRSSVGPTTVFRDSVKMSGEPPRGIHPPTAADVHHINPHSDAGHALEQEGLTYLATGSGAVVVLAGGSGTRLGVSYPKGMLACPDLVVKKPLFQLQCEKIRRVQELAAAGPHETIPPIPLVYMTSPANDAQIRGYFAEHKYFGLQEDQVLFCSQSTMPCFTEDGRIILSRPGAIAEAPGGNAGVYGALDSSGVLGELERRGVEYCQVVNVDNMLVRIADPIFFGLAARSKGKLDVAVKSVPKAHDHEAVGVFARRSYPAGATAVDASLSAGTSLWGVVEYTEIGAELAAAKDEATGERQFNCGNVGLHLFSMRFLRRAANAMRAFSYYHVARKPIPTELAATFGGGADGASVKGIKLEAFIFDLFLLVDPSPTAGAFALIQADRTQEFAPIKNADDPVATAEGGEIKRDSPAAAVRDLHALHAVWLKEAFALVPEANKALGSHALPARVEMSPLFASLGATDVARHLRRNTMLAELLVTAAVDHKDASRPFVIGDGGNVLSAPQASLL
jgi:UDP-N-acetylglucosamine/UDP-N-acetylgalactosamine diphosphorylase